MFVDSSFLIDLGRGREAATQFYHTYEHAEFSTLTVIGYELFGGLVAQGQVARVEELRRDLD